MDKRNERVALHNLVDHRSSHDFQFPTCLCAALDTSTVTESAIYMATKGPNDGCWVASCAKGLCGYFGQPSWFIICNQSFIIVITVPLDRLFLCEDMPTNFYPRRANTSEKTNVLQSTVLSKKSKFKPGAGSSSRKVQRNGESQWQKCYK